MIKRKEINGKQLILGFHTQSWTAKTLNAPTCCNYRNAWLGRGYYFWLDKEIAKYWGEDFKKGEKRDGYYNIYHAWLDTENCLNTTFDEEHYYFFCEKIAETIAFLTKNNQNGHDLSLKRVHEYLAENYWIPLGITGIVYDDLPSNSSFNIDRKHSNISYEENKRTQYFYYRKRIQIVLFQQANIHEFGINDEDIECS